jgi:hypothetical protein
VLLCLTLISLLPAAAAPVVVDSGGLSLAVDSDGSYSISASAQSWRFSGSVGAPIVNLLTISGNDASGLYTEISFDFHSDAPRHAAIRLYNSRPAVLFSVASTEKSSNTFPFPNFADYPRNLRHLTFTGTFAPPSFTLSAPESPWIFFDSSANTFILSAASNFMTAATSWGPHSEMAHGIAREISTLPAGFTQQALLVIDSGINRTFNQWGHVLTALQGKTRPPNDADATLEKVGYWTDNGAPYYYKTAGNMNYVQTLGAVKADFDRAGIGLGHLQLDSWFYPKGPDSLWSANGSGIYQYTASPVLFPLGLQRFQRDLGVPLIVHSRWVDASSPIRLNYRVSGNVVTDPLFWNQVADYLSISGVSTFEQDWLNTKAQPDFNLTDPDAFMDNMAAAMASRGLTMQYCMAGARHFLQGSKYSHLTTARTSGDRLQGAHWTDFLFTSRLAASMGIWPFTDNFRSSETAHLLIATLSAGPVGLADAVGELNVPNLLRSVRRDGVIVKPDVPLTPVDRSYLAAAAGNDAPMIAATYTDHGRIRTHYVLAYPIGSNHNLSFSTRDFDLQKRSYVYDYFSGTGAPVGPHQALEFTLQDQPIFLIAAPIGPSGIAVLGDLDNFVSTGKKRISSLTDDGTVRFTVAFAKGESARLITGFSRHVPVATASSGTVQSFTFDPDSRRFQLRISPGADGTASISLQRPAERPRHAGE